MIKSYGIAFNKINAKIAGSGEKCPFDFTGPYMLSMPSFNPKPSITLPMLPRKFISNLNPLKRITMSICRDFDISKDFMYKGWSKIMHGVSILNFGSLVIECTVTRNILQCDLMHWDRQLEDFYLRFLFLCEVFLNMF